MQCPHKRCQKRLQSAVRWRAGSSMLGCAYQSTQRMHCLPHSTVGRSACKVVLHSLGLKPLLGVWNRLVKTRECFYIPANVTPLRLQDLLPMSNLLPTSFKWLKAKLKYFEYVIYTQYIITQYSGNSKEIVLFPRPSGHPDFTTMLPWHPLHIPCARCFDLDIAQSLGPNMQMLANHPAATARSHELVWLRLLARRSCWNNSSSVSWVSQRILAELFMT